MPYKIVIKKSAAKQITAVPKSVKESIFEHIFELSEEPRPPGCKKLKGEENAWRIRIGNWRVVYTIEDEILTIEVIKVAHRKDVYK